MRRLIITADDLGRSHEMDSGIADTVRQGLVTAVSVMATGETVESGLAGLAGADSVSLGLHLVFTQGRPLSASALIPSLVTPDGAFESSVFRLSRRRVDVEHVFTEAKAQIARFQSLTGKLPLFLNTHQHAHLLSPILSGMLMVCAHHGISRARLSMDHWPLPTPRLRSFIWPLASVWAYRQQVRYLDAGIQHPDRMLGGPTSERLTTSALCGLLSRVGDGLTELVVHPALGSVDSDALASAAAERILQERSIRRVGFDVL